MTRPFPDKLIRKRLRKSSDELGITESYSTKIISPKDFTTPSTGSQSNDRAMHLISSHSCRRWMCPRNPDEPNRVCLKALAWDVCFLFVNIYS